jgi:hypothetical protein
MIDRNDSYDPDDQPGTPMESLPCGTCGQPATSWIYLTGADADGNVIIDGFAVCAAHQAAHQVAAA